jgi:hypothetical protein
VNNNIAILFVIMLTSLFGVSQNTVLTILDEEQRPVPNAHILVKETAKFLLSDLDGKAIIKFESKDTLT